MRESRTYGSGRGTAMRGADALPGSKATSRAFAPPDSAADRSALFAGLATGGWIAPALCWRTYSITSSARASRVAGTSRSITFAILRLMTNSNRVGKTIGKSAGRSPFRIFPV